MNKRIALILFKIFLWIVLMNFCGRCQTGIIICGSVKNDIITLFNENAFPYQLCDDPSKAVRNASPGSGILFLADGYPLRKTVLADSIFSMAKRKQLRIYIEYPGYIPGIATGDTVIHTQLERGVVTTHQIADLDSLSLLGIHNSLVVPVKTAHSLIVLGRVAGFDKAVYGLNDVITCPLLFQKENVLVASSRLSDCITGRFDPAGCWQKVWSYILNWLDPAINWTFTHWPLQVAPSYGREEKLPAYAFKGSIEKGCGWFYKARFFVDSSWEQLFLRRTGNGTMVEGPPVDPGLPAGDGSLGILEGQVSRILADGSQPYRWWNRADDQAGAAYALAMAGRFLKQPGFLQTSRNLLNYLFIKSNLRAGPRNNNSSPSYGLIGWATTHANVYYGDDNARTILSSIGAAASLHTDEWNDFITEAIMGNFRTAGKNGFRGNALEDAPLQEKGWKYFGNREIINVHPHYEAWLWACYLWLYGKTGYKPLLDKAKTAIQISMDSFPRWKWTNSIQDERTHMILPLAWLVRIEDTKEHRFWLKEVVDTLLTFLQPCGAIQEEIGAAKNGKYGPPRTNKEYGTSEAPLIAGNGDPAADLLYTENFAFFSLNEAAHVLGDSTYRNAVKRMADFLIRIQVKSLQHPALDGAWFRAFNYRQWDYWASNADAGWGAYCTQTGWIQAWVLSTLLLTQEHSCFWDETKWVNIKKQAMPVISAMSGL